MIQRIKYFLSVSILVFAAQHVTAADTTVVHDLVHDWYFYDDGSESYFPLVSKSAFRGETIHFEIDSAEFPSSLINIKVSKAASVFVNNRMLSIIKGQRFYSLDSIRETLQGNLHFTVYDKYLDPFELETTIISITPTKDKPLAENPMLVRTKKAHSFHNFAIIAFLILAAFIAALNNYFSRSLSDFFRVYRAFSLRDTEENLYKTRPLSQVNLVIYIFLSLLIALVFMLIVYQSDIHLETRIFNPEGFVEGLWSWLRLSALVLLWFAVKYLLINNLSSLFKLGGFAVSHFYNYVRMSLMIFIVAIVFLIISYFGLDIYSPDYYRTFLNIIFIFLGIRVVILFFKLLSSASYQNLHLFSYLCGTEVIPLGILLYLGLNQPF